MTGSAPLSETVMDFLRVCFSCPVFEGSVKVELNSLILGYGQTENAAALTTTVREDYTTGFP